jgi:uncharacterized protein YeaO (DUF488 family)
MALKLFEYAWREGRLRGEGIRLSCTRYLPRGVKKKNYANQDYFDVWMPTLAPSQKLMQWAKRRDLYEKKNLEIFAARYRREMHRTNARQMIRAIAKIAKRTPISIGCRCPDKPCHRFELEKLIRAAAVGKF